MPGEPEGWVPPKGFGLRDAGEIRLGGRQLTDGAPVLKGDEATGDVVVAGEGFRSFLPPRRKRVGTRRRTPTDWTVPATLRSGRTRPVDSTPKLDEYFAYQAEREAEAAAKAAQKAAEKAEAEAARAAARAAPPSPRARRYGPGVTTEKKPSEQGVFTRPNVDKGVRSEPDEAALLAAWRTELLCRHCRQPAGDGGLVREVCRACYVSARREAKRQGQLWPSSGRIERGLLPTADDLLARRLRQTSPLA